MKIEEHTDASTGKSYVRVTQVGGFTEWQTATLFANGFKRDGKDFVCYTPGAEYAARMIKQGGIG